MDKLKGKKIGVAITGSFCTFGITLDCINELIKNGAIVTPILSYNTSELDTKFGEAKKFKQNLFNLTGSKLIETIPETEPIGPGKILDALVVLPATGNTLAKITAGIADTPASFAVKSQLRNARPIILGVSSNDALSTGAKNIGHLLNTKNIYFIPFGQDDCVNKPCSIVFKEDYVTEAVALALEGKQIQPIIVQ